MSSPVRLASFCRLCLTKTKDKVPVFAEGNLLESLLTLIEIDINADDEPDAVVCYDCVVTLEGFHQFKEQCHVNDEFVKTIPTKAEGAASSEGEEDEEEDNAVGNASEEEQEGREDEDHLELSEAEEVFHTLPSPKPKKRGTYTRKSVQVKTRKEAKPPVVVKDKPIKATLDELQVLQDSYPDFFYFEKGSRSIYYTLVFYGERFNSALFSERTTYWQCIHRRKFACPAQVRVTNDYKTFERHFEHTHKEQREKEGQAFTPTEALPELFKICKRIVEQKKLKADVKEETFESKFQEFAEDSKLDIEDDYSSPKTAKQAAKIYTSDSDEESDSPSEVRPKRKIKQNANTQQKKRAVEKPVPETKIKSKKSPTKKAKPKYDDDEDDMDSVEEEHLDLDQIEQECDALNVPKRPYYGPTLEDMLVVSDSYPDFFFFEKGPRSIYFTLVYYGERFHSALFTERYTYWQCRHRRKYKCPAQVAVTNDYKTFERRYEHTHPDLPDKEGQAFTPLEALPELFEACRKIVHKNRAKRRQKLLHKYQFLNSINSTEDQEQPSTGSVDVDEVELVEIIDEDDVDVDDGSRMKDLEYEELIEED